MKKNNIMKHSFKRSDNEDEDSNASKDENDDIDTNITFDFAQLNLSVEEVLKEVKEKGIDKDIQCKECDYTCKCHNTFKKHLNTKLGAKKKLGVMEVSKDNSLL